jgi:hypothetical protein
MVMECEICFEEDNELMPYDVDNGVLHICEFCIEDMQDTEDEPINQAIHSAAALNFIRK